MFANIMQWLKTEGSHNFHSDVKPLLKLHQCITGQVPFARHAFLRPKALPIPSLNLSRISLLHSTPLLTAPLLIHEVDDLIAPENFFDLLVLSLPDVAAQRMTYMDNEDNSQTRILFVPLLHSQNSRSYHLSATHIRTDELHGYHHERSALYL